MAMQDVHHPGGPEMPIFTRIADDSPRNPSASPTKGISFISYTIFPYCRCLKPGKGIYFQRKLRAMIATHRAGEVPLAASVQGWVN